MTGFRQRLPQLEGGFFLTDGGLETTLIFLEGLELPHFAAFDLLKRTQGQTALRDYFRTYCELAQRFGTGLVLESPTWRASADWGDKLGYDRRAMASANEQAIALLDGLRGEFKGSRGRIVISGCVGPRGDGYSPRDTMTEKDAEAYHGAQIETFAGTAADLVTAITMNYVEEAIGIARAAERRGLPAALSFTVEVDGRLPTGDTLGEAIEQVEAATAGYPSYYMINCAHPTHFEHALHEGQAWTKKLRGLRANASRKSHAELDESAELDDGDPVEFGTQYAALRRRLPQLAIMGGCCGTDHRHVEQIALACA